MSDAPEQLSPWAVEALARLDKIEAIANLASRVTAEQRDAHAAEALRLAEELADVKAQRDAALADAKRLRKRTHEIAEAKDRAHAARHREMARLQGMFADAQRWADESLRAYAKLTSAGGQWIDDAPSEDARPYPWWLLASEHNRGVIVGLLSEGDRLRKEIERLRKEVNQLLDDAEERPDPGICDECGGDADGPGDAHRVNCDCGDVVCSACCVAHGGESYCPTCAFAKEASR